MPPSDNQCSFHGCTKRSAKTGICIGHYHQRLKGRALTTLTGRSLTAGMSVGERFWAKVDKSGECWEWTGSTRGGGYGSFKLNGRVVSSHRMAFELSGETIPDGWLVDHMCHNRLCCNPTHMQLATVKENAENRARVPANNTSGFLGVTRYGNRWKAQVGHNGRILHLGIFDRIEDARDVAIEKRTELFSNNLLDRREPLTNGT